MPDPTLVTVVIPVFNTPKEFLKQALDSVAEQTLNRRLIGVHIIDDASTAPGTVKFLSRLERKNRYRGIGLKVSRNTENQWVAACRCAGAEQAGTDYVVFLDSDDALDCDYLKKAVLLLEANPKASWAYPGTRTFGDSHHLWPAEPFRAFNVWFKRLPHPAVAVRWAAQSASHRRLHDL
jgi:glycosyltransferase involved in cell wall biosynthesis